MAAPPAIHWQRGMTKLWEMRALMPLAGRFPRFFYAVAWVLGWLAWELRPGMRRRVTRNLLPFCDGDRAKARREGKEVLRNVARYYVDLSSIPHRDIATYEAEHLTIRNAERLAVLGNGEPVIIVSCHTGNPELALQALTTRGRSFLALVEPLRPPAMARYLRGIRSSAGGTFVNADLRGARAALETLNAGGIVAIVADRDIQGTGVCTPLAGREVRIGQGPWELARRTGAVILPVFARRRGHADQEITVHEPYRVDRDAPHAEALREAATRFAGLLDAHIREEPRQWTVHEDFWEVHRCG
ncbi:MAG: lysophospholipid acyltransferase family protein [Tepidiformaceae bacterium]